MLLQFKTICISLDTSRSSTRKMLVLFTVFTCLQEQMVKVSDNNWNIHAFVFCILCCRYNLRVEVHALSLLNFGSFVGTPRNSTQIRVFKLIAYEITYLIYLIKLVAASNFLVFLTVIIIIILLFLHNFIFHYYISNFL